MTLPQQKILQEQLPRVQSLFRSHAIETAKIDKLSPLIECFEIRLPFIGGFSSGKSSLINALIDEPLLSTEVTPETAVAAELRYGKERSFVGHFADGESISFTQEDVQENRITALAPKGWLSIELPSKILAKTPQLVLVDMPGWGSGVEAHHLVIDAYADRSLAYAVVVSAEEGTLRDSLRKALLELAVQEKPVILVIAKAHKRNESDVAHIAKNLTQEIAELMGRAPLAVAITSAAKQNVGQLQEALKLLQSRLESVFDNTVTKSWRSELQRASQLMQGLAAQDFKDAEAISAEIEMFEGKMAEFDQRLIRETTALEGQIEPIAHKIRMQIERSLSLRLDTLTERAVAGGNVSDDILGTARLVVSQSIKEEFEPTMLRYLDRLEDALPSKIDFDFSFTGPEIEIGQVQSDFHWKELSRTLSPVLLAIPHPLAKIAAVVLPILGGVLGGSSKKQQQELEEARNRERVKGQIRDALVRAAEQIGTQLEPALKERLQKAKEMVAQNIAIERTDIEKMLVAKRDALRVGETEAANQRAKAQASLQELQSYLMALPSVK